MVTYAARHVPHYREALGRLGLTAGDVQTAMDLARFPLIRREDLQRDLPSGSCRPPCRGGAWWSCAAGGAPAPRGRVSRPRGAVPQRRAQRARWVDPVPAAWPPDRLCRQTLIASDFQRHPKGADLPGRPRAVPASDPRGAPGTCPLADPPADNLARINAFRPDVLHTYSSYLGCLFAFAHGGSATAPRDHLRRRRALSPRRPLAHRTTVRHPRIQHHYQSIEALRIGSRVRGAPRGPPPERRPLPGTHRGSGGPARSRPARPARSSCRTS